MIPSDLAKALRGIDFAMLTNVTPLGDVAFRPMSNNGEVEFSGITCYFTWFASRMCKDIEANPEVGLTFLGRRPNRSSDDLRLAAAPCRTAQIYAGL
jgi:general stress protein 26